MHGVRHAERGEAMNGFYRFPEIRHRNKVGSRKQLAKVLEECSEACDAHNDWSIETALHCSGGWALENVVEARDAYGMELMDVIHAAETVLRMEFSETEVEMLRDAVERKNREMGYYGAAAGEGGAGCTAPA